VIPDPVVSSVDSSPGGDVEVIPNLVENPVYSSARTDAEVVPNAVDSNPGGEVEVAFDLQSYFLFDNSVFGVPDSAYFTSNVN